MLILMLMLILILKTYTSKHNFRVKTPDQLTILRINNKKIQKANIKITRIKRRSNRTQSIQNSKMSEMSEIINIIIF